MHWWTSKDHQCFFPRSFVLSDLCEQRSFIIDFRRSAAAGILRLHLSLTGDLLCCCRIALLAKKATDSWVKDLTRHLPPEGISSDDDDFSSDGLSSWEWDEVLDYSGLLCDVADSIENARPSSSEQSIVEFNEFSTKLTARVLKKSLKPPRELRQVPAYRPPSNGIPSLAELQSTVDAPERSNAVRRRHLWQSTSTFDALFIDEQTAAFYFSQTLSRLVALWPQASIDCLRKNHFPRNCWILKSPGVSRGTGISVSRTLSEILDRENGMGGRVVQK
jgi:hypothetical protein